MSSAQGTPTVYDTIRRSKKEAMQRAASASPNFTEREVGDDEKEIRQNRRHTRIGLQTGYTYCLPAQSVTSTIDCEKTCQTDSLKPTV